MIKELIYEQTLDPEALNKIKTWEKTNQYKLPTQLSDFFVEFGSAELLDSYIEYDGEELEGLSHLRSI